MSEEIEDFESLLNATFVAKIPNIGGGFFGALRHARVLSGIVESQQNEAMSGTSTVTFPVLPGDPKEVEVVYPAAVGGCKLVVPISEEIAIKLERQAARDKVTVSEILSRILRGAAAAIL